MRWLELWNDAIEWKAQEFLHFVEKWGGQDDAMSSAAA